jgi:hypothetical protein
MIPEQTDERVRMGDDIHDPFGDIRARFAGSSIRSQLVNIQAANVPQQKSLEFLEKLNCLYFKDPGLINVDENGKISMQPLLKLLTINAFTLRKYIALSYTWRPSPEEINIPVGGYWVEDIQTGKIESSSVRDNVFSRMRRYMDYFGVKYLWIDKHCIQQEEGEEKEIGMQAMDRVYSLSYHPVALLSRTIETTDQLQLLDEILSGSFVVRRGSKYWLSSPANWERACYALRLLDYITSDTWFTRGWTYQENYRANMRMTLLITHSATLNHQKTSKYVGSLEGELCISSSMLYEQTTKLCLAYSNHQPPPRYLSSVLLRAKRYTVLLTEESSAPVSMSPTIIEDIANRTLEREWDILAIVANCCQYSNRLNSTKLQHGKQSLSLSLLALCLINGEIFSNHPEDDFDVRATRSMTITQLLHKHFFQGLESPWSKAKLTFNKSCRFSNVVLTDVGVQTEGYLWRLDDEIPTTDFRRYSPPRRRRKKQLWPEKRPLEWLVDELAGQYPVLSHRLYEVLELNTRLPPSGGWLLSMAKKVEEAIEEGKDLCTATLLGPGPLGVAIFVCQPEENGGSSNESDESSELGSLMDFDDEEEEECYVFTSFQPAKYNRQCFDLNDLDKHVSIEVDCDFGMGDRKIPRLYVRRWIQGLCFYYDCSPEPVVFPWPQSLGDM